MHGTHNNVYSPKSHPAVPHAWWIVLSLTRRSQVATRTHSTRCMVEKLDVDYHERLPDLHWTAITCTI